MSFVWNKILEYTVGDQHLAKTKSSGQTKHDESVKAFNTYFLGGDKQNTRNTDKSAQKMVNYYYDLVTDFYEYGWGQSFHFAPRFVGEGFDASLARHEHFLSAALKLKKGDRVLDVGCGVMGPARAIARFSGCDVVGLNNNEYQLKRAEVLNKRAGLQDQLSGSKADFMHLPFEDNSFDAIYAIEATCHAPDRYGCYKGIYDKLKPGAYFGCYEWVVTDNFDPKNKEHRRIMDVLEKGNALPPVVYAKDIRAALKKAGFVVEHVEDLAATAGDHNNDVPWYAPLTGGCTLTNFRQTKLGRQLTHAMCTVLEKLHIAPKGTVDIHHSLSEGAVALVEGGRRNIFTPMLFCLARKPE